MKSSVEKTENNKVKLEIEVGIEKFEEGMEKSYKKNVKNFNIPGFRKGKAPRNIVERYYGAQVLYDDAVNYIYPDAYDQAIKDNELYPVEKPQIEIKEIGNEKGLIFTAEFTVKPEVELGQYKGIEAEKKVAVVTEDDVEAELNTVAEKNSRLISVEDRPVQDGDTTIIDFEGFENGEPFEGGEGKNYSLVIGSGQFIPGFEEQLIGVDKNKELDINLTFPEDYGHEALAGKPVVFKVTVNEIKTKELPEINDEFAQDVSEFDTLDEYKADLRKTITEKEEQKIKFELEEQLIKKITDNAEVDIPEVMVESRINSILYELDSRLRYQGMELQSYLAAIGQNIDEFRKQYHERALSEVKTQLVLEKIKEVEKLEADESEFDQEVIKFAENSNKTKEEFMKQLTEDDIDYIKNNILVRKTIELIVNSAVLA